MVPLAALWLPILLAAVLVFFASSVIHMVLPIHKGDYRKLPDEDRVLDGLRSTVPPGQYMFPLADSMREMSSPALVEKFRRGPVGTMILRPPGDMNMGKALLAWMGFCLLVSVGVAYLTGLVLPAGNGQMFRVATTAAMFCYAFSSVSDSIWKGVRWITTLKFLFDGSVYALVTGATFAWLWPAPV